MRVKDKIKLNLGCGAIRPDGWLNTDSSLNSLIQNYAVGKIISKFLGSRAYDTSGVKYMNLNKRWNSIKDGSASVVYASHLFEHIQISATRLFLQESFRALSSGGVIRLVMPDMYLLSKHYVQQYERTNEKALEEFMWALNLHREGQYPKGSFKHSIIGWFQGYPHQHKFMYDKNLLQKMVEEAGFSQVRFSEFGKSEYIKDIQDVEFDKSLSYAHSMYMDALKP